MRIEVAGKSHVGMKRNINEDNFLVMPDQRLYCVADGMGGHSPVRSPAASPSTSSRSSSG